MITLTELVYNQINLHGQDAFPFECCGFLLGVDNQEGRIATLAVSTENVKVGDQRRRFEISPLDYLRAERFAIDNDLQFVGIYHSHPNHPAIASEHDLAQAIPWFSYVIVSVMGGIAADIKSWRLRDDERVFDEEAVETYSLINQ